MKFSPNNFLQNIKNIVTGGGFQKDGVNPTNDCGFKVDKNLLLDSGLLLTGTTYIADTDGYPIFSNAATNTAITTIPFFVPRDYDEATDEIIVRFVANMGGATDTPTVTVTAGQEILTATNAATYKATAAITVTSVDAVAGAVSTALSATRTRHDAVIRNAGLKRDTLVFIKLTAGAHTTDTVQVAAIGITYRSTLVSYNETDGVNPSTGAQLRS